MEWRGRIEGRVLVTGAAGFIGAALSEALLEAGIEVVGFDSLDPYYDPRLKAARLARLEGRAGWRFVKADLADRAGLEALFAELRPDWVVNLAAQAGVRHSIEKPHAYADANLVGFLNLLEACRAHPPRHLVYASSSSVYGGARRTPFRESDAAVHPVSLYAATKRANELMAHAYADLYALPATGLRFFTVYGPRGRPDMACWKFTEAVFAGRPIEIYNHGRMARDFTYVDDIVEGVARVIPHVPAPDPDFDRTDPDPARSWAAHRVFNIGARRPEPLMRFVELIERFAGREAEKRLLPMQPGDVKETFADMAALEAAVGFAPKVTLEQGVERFVAWYRDWAGV